ncbi:MAG: TetR/AcrR family transcriptional regulator [Acidimicrobiia bacterium]
MDGQDSPKRKRLSAAARRELILAAARDVFLENGQAGGRLRDIADRAGITEAYLYRYFTSKDELYQAAVYEPVEPLIEEFAAKIEAIRTSESITGLELLRRLNEVMLEWMTAVVPYLGVTLLADLNLEDTYYKTTIYPRVYQPVEGLLAAVAGWPAPGIDLDVVVNAMWGLNYGIALDALLRGVELDVPKVARRVTRLYTIGIPQFRTARGPRPAEVVK